MKKPRLYALALLLAICLCACSEAAPVSSVEPTSAPTARPTPEPRPTPVPTPEPTPEPTPTVITLSLAGDIVMHTMLNDDSLLPDGSYDYGPILADAAPYISEADFALCCMETALTGSGNWTGYPMFTSPDDLAYSLKAAGFDLINMASNHSMDGFFPGLVRTLDVLDEAGLHHVGTYRSQEERDVNNGIVVEDINGVSIAFLNYSYGTNGIPVWDEPYSVNVYYLDYMDYFNHIDYEMIDADMAAARALRTDLIAVSVHWGGQYVLGSTQPQRDFADYLFAAGADMVIGGHPHVPEPMELRTLTDEDGNERLGFLCYCLGNFISGQNQPNTDLSAIVQLEISKDPLTSRTEITDAGYIPMVMIDLQDNGIINHDWRFRLWDLRAAIADYEAGDDRGVVTEYMYNGFLKKLETCRQVFGELEQPVRDMGEAA